MKRISSTSDFGSLIRKTRKEQGLTQIELAGLSGVGTRFLSELERGKASCEIGKTLQILNMLGLNAYVADEADQ